MAASYKNRIKDFQDCLDEEKIDTERLRKLCFAGIPDLSNIRSLCWKILLYYLPSDKKQWEPVLEEQRALYKQFVKEIIIQPGKEMHGISQDEPTITTDHPLNSEPSSQWSAFFKDNDVLLQIDKDTRRLQPDLCFFQSPTEFPCQELLQAQEILTLRKRVEHTLLISSNVEKKRTGITNIPSHSKTETTAEFGHNPCAEGQEAHWEVLERILFIYAKLNPGQSYVQGMNEIIGPLYYVFALDTDPKWRKYAEEDTFFCFTNLMGNIRDIFIKTLDHSEVGIHARMRDLVALLKRYARPLWNQLDRQGIKPEFFSFRWLTVLLTQEFPLPDVIRLWDSLLSDDDGSQMLLHICCAMVLLQRKELMKGDFASNIKLLQHYPSIDVHVLLKSAVELRNNVTT